MEPITYSLRGGQKYSDEFYREASAFTDRVLEVAQERLGGFAEEYRGWLAQTGREEPRSLPEYLLEALYLGVLWQVYAPRAQGLRPIPQHVLTTLYNLRERYPRLKDGLDFLRGRLAGAFLLAEIKNSGNPPEPGSENLERLLEWLAASGDFAEAVRRLRGWQAFLSERNPERCAAFLSVMLELAVWFETQSLAALGAYTPNVERFRSETLPGYRGRADALFCGRQRVEYHLNMVGTEVLNRTFRAEFLATERKVVILPPCMRARPEDECQAKETAFGSRCGACTPTCRVHQTTQLGKKHGFEVLILPDDLSVFAGSSHKAGKIELPGVVGVSCVLTNTPGGWDLRERGVPAQGLFLDYCGCSYHWHPQGIPTDINFGRLLEVMGIDSERE